MTTQVPSRPRLRVVPDPEPRPKRRVLPVLLVPVALAVLLVVLRSRRGR
ncbi:hypothetical protein GCM10022243_12730 [Saccharothrix violaceirubra]|uniref:Uncharacterized protein n=1 Tax=Saccharothrix violaceirubra TaxID=413306 RepID=A0A7W7T9C9_9PSEU|nr:hypothetical protein [Saccharothrix violaceirubra]MBB4968771.1 hypothetical protein [Saccharothrix violaceirubra]